MFKMYFKNLKSAIKTLWPITNIFKYFIYFLANILSYIILFARPIFSLADIEFAKNKEINYGDIFNNLNKSNKYYKMFILSLFKFVILLLIIALFSGLFIASYYFFTNYYERYINYILIILIVLAVIVIYSYCLKFRSLSYLVYNGDNCDLKEIYNNTIKTSKQTNLKELIIDLITLLFILIMAIIYFIIIYCLIIRGIDIANIIAYVLLTILSLINLIYLFPLLYLTRSICLFDIYHIKHVKIKKVKVLTLTNPKYYNEIGGER